MFFKLKRTLNQQYRLQTNKSVRYIRKIRNIIMQANEMTKMVTLHVYNHLHVVTRNLGEHNSCCWYTFIFLRPKCLMRLRFLLMCWFLISWLSRPTIALIINYEKTVRSVGRRHNINTHCNHGWWWWFRAWWKVEAKHVRVIYVEHLA